MAEAARSRALVLSGGGPLGLAWETGYTAALTAHGVDLSSADLIVGTSAGASVGALIALGRDLVPVLRRYLPQQPGETEEVPKAARRPASEPSSFGSSGPMAKVQRLMSDALRDGLTPEQARTVVGRHALESETISEDQFIHGFRYLRGEPWPARYVCTAVDAESGAFVLWSADKATDLDRAVASSCAVPGVFPPVTIDGRRYIDGGFRSGSSADLAVGHDLVLIVTLRDPDAPTDGNAHVELSRARMANERKAIEGAGGEVCTATPDAVAVAAMGTNPHDLSLLPVAAAEGVRQGQGDAERLRSWWTATT